MIPLALLCALQAAPQAVPPYLSFPEPGLDDPAVYHDYRTRLYRDARRNTVQIYLNQADGRVVHVWADALDESIGFTVRDTAGRPAPLDWGAANATVAVAGANRTLRYTLALPAVPVRVGLFLLGSMRVERDFQYAGRDTGVFQLPTFVPAELDQLVTKLTTLAPAERRRALALLGARDVAALRARLEPSVTIEQTATTWRVRVAQPSFDGKNHLSLMIAGDARRASVVPGRGVVTIRPSGKRPVMVSVEIATDAAALTPLDRDAIFNDAFRRFYDSVRADTAHPLRFRRLEREVRGFELLSSREKLMAGLPTYATYFGRDMLMTALLMEPIWSDTMAENVIAAALRKLGPAGDVSHEEALGGQAIRENAARYVQHPDAAILADLQAVRENYCMVDDDFQLPVVAAHYFANPRVGAERKRRFVARYGAQLRKNLAYVWSRAEPYAREPVATNLVAFARDPDGWWHPGSWRDSRVGYAGGKYALDVNALWVPAALAAIAVIRPQLDSAAGLPDSATLARAIETWQGAVRHFAVAFGPADVAARVHAKVAALPDSERAHWDSVLARTGLPTDTLRFLAVSLDSTGSPIPVMNTDPYLSPLIPLSTSWRGGQGVRTDIERSALLPYPIGLFVDGLGPVTANDAYAPPDVWRLFARDWYHSPRVVWGRDVNVLLAALARRGDRAGIDSITTAVERSGLRHAELWSYRIDSGGLHPMRYGTSGDVQLWSLTDLAVQFLLAAGRD